MKDTLKNIGKFIINKYFISLSIALILVLSVYYLFSKGYLSTEKTIIIKTKHNIPVVINTKHERASFLIQNETLDENLYPVLDKIIAKGDKIIEIEPDFGLQTAYMAFIVGKKGKVDVFKLDKTAAIDIQYTSAINRLSQVSVFQNLVYSENKWVEVDMQDKTTLPIINNNSTATNKIAAITLDSKYANHHVDAIIIHSTCHDLEILQGAKKLIENNPIISIILQWEPCNLKNYDKLSLYFQDLEDIGFEFFHIDQIGNLSPFDASKLEKSAAVDILITKKAI